MSAYINTQTLEYPLYEGDIRLLHDIPDELTGSTFPKIAEFEKVTLLPRPEYNEDTHYTTVLPPQRIDSKWYVDWSDPIAFTQAELDARAERQRQTLNPNTEDNTQNLNVSGGVPDVIG